MGCYDKKSQCSVMIYKPHKYFLLIHQVTNLIILDIFGIFGSLMVQVVCSFCSRVKENPFTPLVETGITTEITSAMPFIVCGNIYAGKGLPICNSSGYMVFLVARIFFLPPQAKICFYFP